ncbi:hypothetical protein TZ94_01698 [Streptococcus infantis]|uniref:Uncharacterized protein n=1 Tax=Streptococcus infantis TaxID=68892 RepID=A0A0F2DXD1_9STRE|nr:hypothetical protein [Streptococcus infantis]KJQ74176.1 hypothetical protein TZ94_01698 [Streptococcus infantis]
MPINEQQRNSKYTPDRYKSEKPYNDVPCEPNQVLAPFVIRDKEMRQSKDINPNNLKTFKFSGKSVLVGFVPVNIEDFYNVVKIFNMDVKEYLNRYTKCNDLSLDEILDKMSSNEEVGFDPTGVDSHEEIIMMLETISELIEEVERRNKKYGQILRLIYENMDIAKQDIISTLGMKKTQGYAAIKKAQAMAKEVYRELNQ